MIDKDIKKIERYVIKQTRPYLNRDITLLEIILIPEIPFYIIARFNVNNVNSVCDPKLNALFLKTAPLLKKGIFCVFRPNNFRINNKLLDKVILEKSSVIKKTKSKDEKSFFNFTNLSDQLKSIILKRKHTKLKFFIWEMEFSKKGGCIVSVFLQ